MNKVVKIVALALAAIFVGCTADPSNDGTENVGGNTGDAKMVKLPLSIDTRTKLDGVAISWSEGDIIDVNGVQYAVQLAEGEAYVEVTEADSYTAYYPGEGSRLHKAVNHFRVHPMQFYAENSFGKGANPMAAAYTAVDGEAPKLKFKSMMGILRLDITGDAEVASIVVEDRSGIGLSGTFSFDASAGKLTMPTSPTVRRASVVLNCYDNKGKGVALSDTAKPFYIVLPARTYSQGLKITINDTSHRSMVIDSSTPRTIKLNDCLIPPAIAYAPEENCVFTERFDLFVWGGHIMGGSVTGNSGFVPFKPNSSATATATGFERTMETATYAITGTTYMTEDYRYKVVDSHLLSDSYFYSRGLMDYRYLFRSVEHPGYIGVGTTSNSGRGRFETPRFTSLKTMSTVNLEFKVAYQYCADAPLEIGVTNAGYITELYVDGVKKDIDRTNYKHKPAYSSILQEMQLTSTIKLTTDDFAPPASASVAKSWHTVKMTVRAVDNTSSVTFFTWGDYTTAGKCGYYVDDIVVTKVKEHPEDKRLKVIIFNIQNGMWGDEANNYDNFVAWLEKHDPDVCVFCESKTIYKTGTKESLGSTAGYLPGNWGELAKRYGHSYASVGAEIDNYPVTITAKKSITMKKRFDNKNAVSHGGFHAKVDGVNYVGLHLWPMSYGRGVASANQAASTANKEGDAYRLSEMKHIISNSKNYLLNILEKDWIMGGDFNSMSPFDYDYYQTNATYSSVKKGDPEYAVHQYIYDNTDYVDAIGDLCGAHYPHVSGKRIDFIYVSPSMHKRMLRSRMMDNEDNFTTRVRDSSTGFYYYSDHKPTIVEFDMSE